MPEGSPALATGAGEETLAPGLCVGLPCGTGDAHHLIDRPEADVIVRVVGARAPDRDAVEAPDVDARIEPGPDGSRRFARKDGTPD